MSVPDLFIRDAISAAVYSIYIYIYIYLLGVLDGVEKSKRLVAMGVFGNFKMM